MTRILIVDDSPTQLELARTVLEEGGFEPEVAGNGEAALKKLKDTAFDLVISDIVMPGMSGYELCRQIKSAPATEQLPVILLTTLKDPMDIVEGLECGADNFLTKPCEPEHLLARIKHLLENRQLRSEVKRRLDVDVEITFLGKRFSISSEREQILDLLIATFEDIVLKNSELEESQRQLAEASRRVEQYAQQLEGKVQVSEAKYRTLFEAANDAILVIDFETGEIKDANAEAMRLLDMPADELLAANFFDLLPAEGLLRRRRAFRDWIARGRAVATDVEFRRGDGSLLPAEISARRFQFDEGETLVHAIIRDLTEIKRWEAERAHLATFPEESAEAIFEIDDEGRVTYMNPVCEESFAELAAEGFRHALLDPLARDLEALRAGELDHLDHVATLGERTYRLSLSHKVGRGLTRGYVEDITERRSVEAQLQQAQKMEAVGQLTGGIAHDFNNLLTVILGNLQLLERRLAGDERLGKRIATALGAVERGATLTRQLMAFSRKQALQASLVNVNDVVAGLQSMLRRTLGDNVEIVTKLSEHLDPVEIDKHQFENALLNLSINARDAMPSGGKLVIETANVELDAAYCAKHAYVVPGPYVMVAVSDTGTGMPKEVQERVFEPFFTTKEAGKGTGLGMSMVYGFTKQSRGHVNIYSEEGHGTTIKLYFPRAEGEATSQDDAEATQSDETSGTETILVVEDDASVGEVAATLFEDLGYHVVRAKDGPDAVAILEQREDIALLFTDVIMPGGMTGIVLAKEAVQRHPGLKVLYTSGYTANALTQNGHLSDQVELITKPYDLNQLARRVRKILDE